MTFDDAFDVAYTVRYDMQAVENIRITVSSADRSSIVFCDSDQSINEY